MEISEAINILKNNYNPSFSRNVDKNHWRFEILTTEGRSQVIEVLYKEKISSLDNESRIIIESPIGPIYKNINYEILLRKNSELDIGAICIEDLRNNENLTVAYLTLRATHILKTAQDNEIIELAKKVAFGADKLEKELFARDYH